ncbi:ligand-binding sensor domain-containing protein [Spirosoma utsteinense]|uniref:Signal transduction histidine kinase/ligand-binding sensor domain-containing protein n=1 Tax=Spirosoma utsteinense TaxID=2585773 RepID=A0ABR6WCB7_9BACT|nr:two-component regulator propeller domain-containing protein [Spirosoma utsteinense]MBC3788321.1 signal transduction histidine kinase/ligand-binding sensor domain-containing protein [Spirosoma utsteinense]MBC3794227.1 signal transduction histidine kinase/ligand-binding sensor domain-containing protein [Spirosoma utsteinense]
MIFDHLSVKDGLPGSAVYSIAKDKQGFMWFGTRRCPTRYDGFTFRSFLFPETYLITGMTTDSANRMWVASDRQGICRIDPKTLQLAPVPNTPQTTGYLYADSRGNGWFSTLNGIGKIDLHTGAVQLYPLPRTTFLGVKTHGFLEDKQHTIWAFGSDNGLLRLDPRTNRFVCVLGRDCPDPERRFQLYLSRGCLDSDGVLWIGTYGKGLLRVDPQTGQFKFFKTPEAQNWVTCVQEGQDENGRRLFWIGDERGLLVFRPEQQRFFRLTGSKPDPFYVHVLYRDAGSGLVWVGTSDGLLKYNPQDNLIRTVSLPPGLVHQPVQVNVITADRQDTTGQTFWLGLSHTGLVRWHRPTNQFTLIRYPSNRPETMWIEQPGDGQLWIGLRRWDYKGDGVFVYNTRRNRFVTNPGAKRAGTLFSVPFVDHGLIDKQHRLWVGNNDEGLRVLDIRTGKNITYWSDPVIRKLHQNNNFLTDLKMDRNGRIYVGTYKGPYYIHESTHEFIRMNDPIQPNKFPDDLATNSLLISRNGHLWAARWGSVTESRPDGKLLTLLTARNGLFDRENRRLAEDKNGTIWIGNFEGLHAYKPASDRLLRLTTSDGLSQNNTTYSLYIHRGTDLFIGQQNGLNYVNVQALNHRFPVPKVVVSSFQVHEQERTVDLTRPIQLLRSDNAFSVDFAALTYSHLPNVRYAYFLDGLDSRWNYSGLNHRAYYTNLGPGSYTLNLKAADSFGNWSQQPLRLSISVLPAYYETWWFRVFVSLLTVGLLYGLYRYRVNQLLGVQRIRNRISADLHDEIGSSLSGIGILGTMIKQNLPLDHPSGSMVERIVTEARQVSSSLDDIVWSINPHNDELSSLIARMNRYTAELFEASGIAYEITIPDGIERLTLPMEKRQDFYLIAKEAVNNLVKHAHATQAQVTISRDHQCLHLVVEDNGIGFDPAAETSRNGVRNMQSRATKLRGELTIDSIPGQGTRLRLSFPLSS